MKKFRIMLPMLAFVFAVVGAVAGDLMPGILASRQAGANCVDGNTDQATCETSLSADRPVCTITIGSTPFTAYENGSGCTQVLRQKP